MDQVTPVCIDGGPDNVVYEMQVYELVICCVLILVMALSQARRTRKTLTVDQHDLPLDNPIGTSPVVDLGEGEGVLNRAEYNGQYSS